MKSFFSALIGRLQLPSIVFYLNILSFKNRIIWFFSNNRKIVNSEKFSNKFALIALFQKGELREDIKNLITTLKEKGFYVIGVNTLKLDAENSSLFDTYIERYNYGRDFGSYKDGFLEIFKIVKRNDIDPSVLMINDSVFYSYENLDGFIEKMTNNNYEVTGATENFEIDHHIGSFCINFMPKIIKNKKFIKYWKSYRLSDVRPRVIKYGEMGLSKILRKCVSSSKNINIVYSVRTFNEFIENNKDVVYDALKYSRKSPHTGWKIFNMDFVHGNMKTFIKTSFDFDIVKDKKSDLELDLDFDKLSFFGITNFLEYKEYLNANKLHFDDDFILDVFKYSLIDIYAQGSQIHQNYGFNYIMGCAILKNDGIFRGMMNYQDIVNMKNFLTKRDYKEYGEILQNQAFGEHTLIGWKRVAFMHGYI